jgi:rhodanese-related sulfurtransferase
MMVWLWIGLAVVLLVVLGIALVSSRPATEMVDESGGSNPSAVTAQTVEISPAEAFQKLSQGAFFLDVRSQEEWEQVHIQGSVVIPLAELPSRMGEIPGDKEIVVICLSGRRSLGGTDILLDTGFEKVYCLQGGLQAWAEAGYPLAGTLP